MHELQRGLLKARRMVENAESVTVYSHTDCDGITSATILSTLLERLGKDHSVRLININEIDDIKLGSELTIFSDLGSGQKTHELLKANSKVLILDHHPPIRRKNFMAPTGELLELNPIFFGFDGSTDISGGGMSYLLAREFGCRDLSWMGVLAAVGDQQNAISGKMKGLNRLIVDDSLRSGSLTAYEDLSIYGRHTRPIVRALSFFSDVKLPITNNTNECIARLKNLEIPLENGERQRRICDLTDHEKKRLFSEIYRMMINEVPRRYHPYLPRLIVAEVYELLSEKRYTLFRDLSEFSTAVNACNRNNRWELAVKIISGERGAAVDELEEVLKKHRAYLAEKMDKVVDDGLIRQMSNLQYFKTDDISTATVGTIAGMVLGYGDWQKPMIGIAEINDGFKVSLRCSRLLAFDGTHFGSLIRKVAEKVGGSGGGHATACGAYLPPGSDERFLEIFNRVIAKKVNE